MTGSEEIQGERNRVLIVEDDESMGLFATRVLSRAGYVTRQVDSAESALAVLEVDAFDAVLTDVRLPGISGFDLVRRAKADNPTVQFVVMTAYSSAESDREQHAGEYDGFLIKPVTPEDLAAAISAVLPLTSSVGD
jgi:DNA-binding NtrC family response regulator